VVAVLIVPLVAMLGVAVDTTRVVMVQTRLKTAVDSAVIIGARDITDTARNANMINQFWANFQRSAPNSTIGYLDTTVTQLTVNQVDANTIGLSATASVPTTFMNIAGITTVPLASSSQATRAATGMELSLVLDNTGSMAGWPIQSVVTSATDLVNIVYGSGGADTQPNLWVSVVPFTAEVNIGPTHTNWLTAGSYTAGAYMNTTWKGCVMARYKTGDDFTDANPAQSPFTPFFYPSTLNLYSVKGKNGKVTPIPGDDDWSPSKITENAQATMPDNTAVGPNLGCSTASVLPLTASRSSVLSVISQMVANFRGGTFINLGLQAGWWTVSPNWRGVWGSSTLPLNYNTPYMKKVIVLMTDGNNEWYDWNGGAPGAAPSPWVDDGDTDFTAYGRLLSNTMALANNSKANATANINARMTQMCTTIKQNGIIVYTILFNHDGSVSPATKTLFQNCASSPQNYFLDVTSADLQATFANIGGQLANLRVSK
jgi:hypothetical protein